MTESSPISFLNQLYQPLDERCGKLKSALRAASFPAVSAYYNGHYRKNDSGDYEMDYFPIPVISVDGLCDLELNLEAVSVSAKLKRQHALLFPYEKLTRFRFEVYGVEDYLADYYGEGMALDELRSNLSVSDETEFGFSLYFLPDTPPAVIVEAIRFLQQEGFYY